MRQRALAMSVIGASLPLGAAVLTPLLALIVHSMGWRIGAIMVGALILAVGFPLSRLVRNTPESMGLSPLGQTSPAASTASSGLSSSREEDRGFSVGEAMRTAAFWVLVLGSLLQMGVFMGVMIHFIPLLIWKGIEEQTAAFYLATFSFLAIPAALLLGWLADRWYKPRVLSVGTALGMMGLLFLLYGETGTLFLFPPLFVAVEAMHFVIPATIGDFFGRRNFATVRGFFTTFTILGPVAGPLFAGRVYDATESYTLVLQVFILGFALSSLAYWFVTAPRR